MAPLEVAPHVAGAAVDLTLVDAHGDEVDMGSPDRRDPRGVRRCLLVRRARHQPLRPLAPPAALDGAHAASGLVNYPTEWWHWSYGDRYWALTTGAPAAVYGPVALPAGAAA